jgi:PAS domain-containing protein
MMMLRHIAPYLNVIDIHMLKKNFKEILTNQVSELIVVCLFCLIARKMVNDNKREFKNRIKIKNRFKKLLDISPEGIIVIKDNTHIEYMNDQFIELMYQPIISCDIYSQNEIRPAETSIINKTIGWCRC